MSGENSSCCLAYEKLGTTFFGCSDEENGHVDAEGCDIDVQEVDSDKEVEENGHENDNKDNAADAMGEETVWSNEFADFVVSQFNGQPGIKVKVPEEPRSDFFFNLIFGGEMIYLIVGRQIGMLGKSFLPTLFDSTNGKTQLAKK